MKKKLFSVLLVSMLAISLLAGCNNKKDDNKESKNVTESTEVTTEKTVSVDGITVTGYIGDAQKVEMSALTDGDDYKSAMDFIETLTDKNITATEVYNIDLLDKDSIKVQPEKSVNINLKLSGNMLNAEGDGYEVYRREDNNTFKKLNTTVSNNEVGFTTEHFSIYFLVKTSSTTIAVGESDSEAADNSESGAAFVSDSYLSTEQPKQSTPEQDAPTEQPEQQPTQKPEQPRVPETSDDPKYVYIPDGGETCPYETLKWTYYQGHFGFFWANNDPDIKSMDMQVALYPKGGTAQAIMVGSYKDTGVVQFLYNDEMNENTVVMP